MRIDREMQVRKMIASNLNISVDLVQDELGVGDIPEWDSLAHMRLIAALDSELGIVLDIEQSLDIEDVRDIIDVALEIE
jgi:acyl carrier protein